MPQSSSDEALPKIKLNLQKDYQNILRYNSNDDAVQDTSIESNKTKQRANKAIGPSADTADIQTSSTTTSTKSIESIGLSDY